MDLIHSNAYKIFVAELQRHLNTTRQLFEANTQLSSDELYQAGASFHTIRGGAGFFCLEEIARIAGELEKQLMKGPLDLSAERNGIKAKIETLESLAAKIPIPSPQP